MTSLYKILVVFMGILPLFFILATGITVPDGTNNLSGRSARQSSNDSATYHHNAGLLKNAAGLPFELEYADPEQTVIKSFGAKYNFTDLFTLEYFFSKADDPSVKRVDYYDFTDENIDASQHAMFYALWSILRQDTPDFKKYGEWGVFAAEYMHTRNSHCGHDDSHCKEKLSLTELEDLYPNQRPKVRLIYFTGLKMSMIHDVQVGIEKHIHRVHTDMIGRVATMVETFAHQPDAKKLGLCEFAHKAIEISADFSFKLAMKVIDKYNPEGATTLEIAYGSKEMVIESIKATMQIRPELFRAGIGWLRGDYQAWYAGITFMEQSIESVRHLKPKTFTFDPWAYASPNLMSWSKKAYNFVNDKIPSDLGFDQGYNTGHICGAWEGDDKDRSPANIRRVQEYMSTYFGLLERGTRDMYREMIEGTIIAPGQPTLMALYGMNLKWSGPGSITESLKNMEPLREAITTELEKKLISTTSRRDGNYQLCTHRDDAAALCKKARIAREGKFQQKKTKLSAAMRSLVCPLPETDPTLVCQGGRWYWNRDFAHVINFASLDKWNDYHGANLNMNYEMAVKEAYVNYLHFGNNMDDNIDSWTLGHVTGGGIRMPICLTDRNWIDIEDFSKAAPHQRERKQWQFPGICGAVGQQTEPFLAAIDTGYESKNWQAHGPSQSKIEFVSLYYDRLPRIYDRVSPFLSYMSYGRVGMQFPLSDQSTFWRKIWNTVTANPLPAHKRYQVTKGRDADFATIQEATKGMDEFAANVWFCLDGTSQHTVFQRERSHVDLIDVPSRRVNNHLSKCKKWMGKRGLEIETWRKSGHHS